MRVTEHPRWISLFTSAIVRTLPAAALLILISPATLLAKAHWTDLERIVAIGDLHGDYVQYQTLLKLNEIVDDQGHWQAGRTHLVQLGDVPDRGADSLLIVRSLMRLQREASKSGGVVHTLIGNHEAMNILGDLRYVHPGEYAALVTRKSVRLQKNYLAKVIAHRIKADPALDKDQNALRAQLANQYPAGFVEHRVLWQPGGEIARWVAGNPAVIRINRTLFCHGGINPYAKLLPIEELNAGISAVLSQADNPTENPATREDGILWYRGLATDDEATGLSAVENMLAFYDVDRIVIAHTPTRGEIVSRFGGRVIMADTGISAFYGGHVVNLVIEGSTLYSQTPAGRNNLSIEVR
jgi:Calcineurin-like phosphoesterase